MRAAALVLTTALVATAAREARCEPAEARDLRAALFAGPPAGSHLRVRVTLRVRGDQLKGAWAVFHIDPTLQARGDAELRRGPRAAASEVTLRLPTQRSPEIFARLADLGVVDLEAVDRVDHTVDESLLARLDAELARLRADAASGEGRELLLRRIERLQAERDALAVPVPAGLVVWTIAVRGEPRRSEETSRVGFWTSVFAMGHRDFVDRRSSVGGGARAGADGTLELAVLKQDGVRQPLYLFHMLMLGIDKRPVTLTGFPFVGLGVAFTKGRTELSLPLGGGLFWYASNGVAVGSTLRFPVTLASSRGLALSGALSMEVWY